ncbi:alanine racemase [Clostridium mediterraneense]|uniref:alanine racemase n=1 Tax=Clostridium mediterraneense TaxID=1805472 RepID=UPI00082B7BDF|nr:alanine racemase [Clostridium mediterraneense]
MESIRPVWAEVNLDYIRHNMREIRKLTGDKKIISVVKADAYGHGAVDLVPVLLEEGASKLAVAVITEALELRQAGIDAEIMILGYTPLTFSEKLIKQNIEQTVYNLDYARVLSREALKLNTKAKIHIAVDTGMGRIGFLPEEDFKDIVKVCSLPGIEVVGIFTHFSVADELDKTYTNEQFKKFKNLCDKLEERGIHIPLKHSSNSAAIMDLEETYLDAVRPGIITYGYYPSDEVKKDGLDLKPALTLKTNIVHLKKLKKDMYISYGRRFKTERETIVATLPIGYADGYTRLLNGKAKVIINGQLAPVIGSICMDQCMVDVTDIEGVKLGDEVILIGEKNGVKFNADDIAQLIGTINYEIICMLKNRVPRMYLENEEIVKVRNYL